MFSANTMLWTTIFSWTKLYSKTQHKFINHAMYNFVYKDFQNHKANRESRRYHQSMSAMRGRTTMATAAAAAAALAAGGVAEDCTSLVVKFLNN